MATSAVLTDQGIEPSTSGSAENKDQVSVEMLTTWRDLESLRASWNAILERNRKLTIFSTPEWLGSWWRAFGADKQLYTLAFRNNRGDLVCLLPLYLQRVRSGLFTPLWELRFLGDGSTDSDNLDFIILPGYESAVVRSLRQHLLAEPRWTICRLNVMPSDSVMANALLQEVYLAGWKFKISNVAWNLIELPKTWEAYLKQLSHNERAKIAIRRRRLEKRYQVRFYKCITTTELPACLESLFHLHQKRWQARGKPGAFASKARQEFYYDMAQQFLTRGWLALWVLELNGAVVAVQFTFRYLDTVYLLQEGFDPAYAANSVGHALRSYSLRELIESGVRQYDFLAGGDKSKLRWKCTTGNYLNLHFARPGSRGSVYLSLTHFTQTLKSWIRRLLPPLFITFLSKLRRESLPA